MSNRRSRVFLRRLSNSSAHCNSVYRFSSLTCPSAIIYIIFHPVQRNLHCLSGECIFWYRQLIINSSTSLGSLLVMFGLVVAAINKD